ncbi:fasciclin domain-containing protein [Leptospira biflexa]|uniref:fasciclin domain-containing protein n=1 Tax=Leptospira biflexa TaxID=172 RepID=UPI0010916B45|nr:fasciclin domain-containing protein [Leptospira biflexa]TGM47380.1 fasciclin domain-containing protein [Leptospira biflexa]TGM50154.1 fasciclin domain-containing protein [Leptospira biflexa]
MEPDPNIGRYQMKNQFSKITMILILSCLFVTATNCGNGDDTNAGKGISSVADDKSQQDVLKIAIGSKDHTTLVAAVQAAGLVDSLANQGPFTVFAPTNDAFAKLPAGTVDDLLKPSQKDALKDILEYHVVVGNLSEAILKSEFTGKEDTLGMANGADTKVTIKNGKTMINGATIIASIPAANGIIHVVDTVLLPPNKNK